MHGVGLFCRMASKVACKLSPLAAAQAVVLKSAGGLESELTSSRFFRCQNGFAFTCK